MAFSLFGRKEPPKPKTPEPPSLPRAVAFVDYESWYVSLKTTYAISPDISGWFAELNQQYQLVEVTFFADFSRKCYADELRRIRPYTNKIIDTRSPNGVEKDYTDFILLDNLYQKALSATDIQTFILFSGDETDTMAPDVSTAYVSASAASETRPSPRPHTAETWAMSRRPVAGSAANATPARAAGAISCTTTVIRSKAGSSPRAEQ